MRPARTVRTVTPGLNDDRVQPLYRPVRHDVMPDRQRRPPPPHRALRLIMTVGGVAAGLCLVVGLVTLVVATGGTSTPHAAGTQSAGGHRSGAMVGPKPRQSQQPTSAPSAGAHHHNAWLSRGSRHLTPGPIIASFDNHGTAETPLFTIAEPGTWRLTWSYHCRAEQSADFVLGETRSSTRLAITINRKGTSEHGSYWVMNDAGQHSMVVVSGCSWRLQVAALAPGT
jgi:hypothetical protein